ncbi:MAG: RNA 2'-phosphotransferase [Candidatus Omnitrophica bacterium]|nr:RNA 2'-phosphotransferase [Candidatus Omnitrophota bacterium]
MIPYEFNAERFSRWMAYVLRHNPERYGLQIDRHGYVNVEEFMKIAQRRYPDLSVDQLKDLIASSGSARFELAGSLVRARYGHSIPVEPVGPPVEPPPQLYYGTEAARLEALLDGGLSPVDRRMLHLSVAAEEALSIARRKTEQPAVIRVLAREASQAGVSFYLEGAVYLASFVPARFLQREPLAVSSP